MALAASWASRTVTTDPPRYTPHLEWSLEVALSSTQEFRTVAFVQHGEEYWWGLRTAGAGTQAELSIKFFPHNWQSSDDVQVNVEGHRFTVDDPLLKADPRKVVSVIIPAEANIGELIRIADLREHDLSFLILAIAGADTEARRLNRWRMLPRLASGLPEPIRGLGSGRQTGHSRPRQGGSALRA
jgi:hypothetical protein